MKEDKGQKRHDLNQTFCWALFGRRCLRTGLLRHVSPKVSRAALALSLVMGRRRRSFLHRELARLPSIHPSIVECIAHASTSAIFAMANLLRPLGRAHKSLPMTCWQTSANNFPRSLLLPQSHHQADRRRRPRPHRLTSPPLPLRISMYLSLLMSRRRMSLSSHVFCPALLLLACGTFRHAPCHVAVTFLRLRSHPM